MIVADKSEDDVYQLWPDVGEAGSVIIIVSSTTLSESDYCRHKGYGRRENHFSRLRSKTVLAISHRTRLLSDPPSVKGIPDRDS
jgi:hypothetical protein